MKPKNLAHPITLWEPPSEKQPIEDATPALQTEIVRPMGVQLYHQRQPGNDAALCGELPPAGRRGRWNVVPKLPKESPFCETCWTIWGRGAVEQGAVSKTTIRSSDAWPFPAHTTKQ